jgi:hypothetical protein
VLYKRLKKVNTILFILFFIKKNKKTICLNDVALCTDEVDSKRLSLYSQTTKSRSGETEAGLKTGEALVTELMHHDSAWPFLRPVTKKEVCCIFHTL